MFPLYFLILVKLLWITNGFFLFGLPLGSRESLSALVTQLIFYLPNKAQPWPIRYNIITINSCLARSDEDYFTCILFLIETLSINFLISSLALWFILSRFQVQPAPLIFSFSWASYLSGDVCKERIQSWWRGTAMKKSLNANDLRWRTLYKN